MKHHFAFALLLGLGLSTQARLNVIATTPDLAAIAREIGGDRAEITAMAKPTEDPHFVDAKPSFIVKLNRADVLIEGGAELEIGWLSPLLEGARNAKLSPGQPGRIVCSRGIAMLEVPTELDRSKGDLHAAGNPHFTTDPMNGKIVAANICEAFAQLEPKSAEFFRENLQKFNARLEEKLGQWLKVLEPFKGRQVVTYHNFWPYLAARFGLKTDLYLEPKPGIPPTPSHLAAVVSQMKAQQIKVILVQPYVSRKSAETVAGLTGAVVLDVAAFPGGAKGTDGYLEWMDSLVQALAKGFAGTR